MIWEDYVRGKSIAIVGPAPLTHDQSAQIDSHDIVYRPAKSPIGGWYGERLDAVYLNNIRGRTILEDDQAELRAKIEVADWWVYKSSTSHRPTGLYRVARKPRQSGFNPNAITHMLFDLALTPCAYITVFGADLYAGGPENAYVEGYPWVDLPHQAFSILSHDPMKNRRVHRAVLTTGKVGGDSRYLAAVSMTDEEYQAVIDRWAACLEEATV
jgi:hypothetical protein